MLQFHLDVLMEYLVRYRLKADIYVAVPKTAPFDADEQKMLDEVADPPTRLWLQRKLRGVGVTNAELLAQALPRSTVVSTRYDHIANPLHLIASEGPSDQQKRAAADISAYLPVYARRVLLNSDLKSLTGQEFYLAATGALRQFKLHGPFAPLHVPIASVCIVCCAARVNVHILYNPV